MRERTPAHLKRESAAKAWLVDQIMVWRGYLTAEEIFAMYRNEYPDVLTDSEAMAGIRYAIAFYSRRDPMPKCAHCGQVMP